MNEIVSLDNLLLGAKKEINKAVYPDNSGCYRLGHILSSSAQWKDRGLGSQINLGREPFDLGQLTCLH